MQNKEINIGTTLVHNTTGQVGIIINKYSENYIVELDEGEGTYKRETKVFTPENLEKEFNISRKAAYTNTPEVVGEGIDIAQIRLDKLAYDIMLSAINFNNKHMQVEPGGEVDRAIEDFIGDYVISAAQDYASHKDSGAKERNIDMNVAMKFSPEEEANEASYQAAMKRAGNDPQAEAAATKEYERHKKRINKSKVSKKKSLGKSDLHKFFDKNYIQNMAQSLWMRYDVIPSLIENLKTTAEENGIDPAIVFEQPISAGIGDMPDFTKGKEIAQGFEGDYAERLKILDHAASVIKLKLPQMKEYEAMKNVLPSRVFTALAVAVGKASTPAEIVGVMTDYVTNRLTQPSPTSKEHSGEMARKKIDPATPGVLYDYGEKGYRLSVNNPEYIGFSNLPVERSFMAASVEVRDALAAKDYEAAEKRISTYGEEVDEYKKVFKGILDSLPKEEFSVRGDSPEAMRSRAIDAEYEEALQKIQTLSEQHAERANMPVEVKQSSHMPNVASIEPGTPVMFGDDKKIHVVVSYDEKTPGNLYLIPEEEINTHERAELVLASITDVTPLKVYTIDVGDVLDAFGSVGRVVDASSKRLGIVYAELKGSSEIVPVNLKDSEIAYTYAKPYDLRICANDKGIITAGEEINCPYYDGTGLLGQPLNNPEVASEAILAPAKDAKAIITTVKEAESSKLTAALESLDVEDKVPEKHEEIYEDLDDPIEIGATVKKFSSVLTGTIVGKKRACYVVDWETGQTETCWPQELVIVSKQSDEY